MLPDCFSQWNTIFCHALQEPFPFEWSLSNLRGKEGSWFVIIISSVANTAYESKGKREAAANKQLPVAPTWHRSGSEH